MSAVFPGPHILLGPTFSGRFIFWALYFLYALFFGAIFQENFPRHYATIFPGRYFFWALYYLGAIFLGDDIFLGPTLRIKTE